MGGFKPVPLDQLPIPGAAAPQQFKPSEMDQQPVPTQQPYGAGGMSAGGKIADVGANFLQGWLKGKQNAEAKKLAMAQQNVEGSHYAFQIAQQNANQIATDPNATPQQKQQAETARQAAWTGYLDVADKYTQPEKGAGKSKGGAKGGSNPIKDHLKGAFGAEDPHIFAQASMALLRKTGPPALQQPSAQDKLAQVELQDVQTSHDATTAVEKAHQNLIKAQGSGNPQEIASAQKAFDNSVDTLRNVSGKPQTADERRKDMLSQASIDAVQGKPVSAELHAQMQAAGYEPQPILPNTFQRVAPDGTAWADVVSADGSVKHISLGKERIPPDQRAEANAIFKDNLKNYGELIRKANPDMTDAEVSGKLAEAMGAGAFKMKGGSAAAGMSPIQSATEVSKAINQVMAQLPAGDQEKAKAVMMQQPGVGGGGKGGGWMFRDELQDTNSYKNGWGILGNTYGGMSKDDAAAYQTQLRGQVRTMLRTNLKLSKPKMTDSQLDRAMDEMMGEQSGVTSAGTASTGSPAQGMDPTPGSDGPKNGEITVVAPDGTVGYAPNEAWLKDHPGYKRQ